MAVRVEERLCAEALKKHLQDQYGTSSTWLGVDSDPPDLRFDVTHPDHGEESWAVEVTGLMQYIEWDGKEENRRVFEPAILKMCKRLNDELGPQMRTSYFLSITGPLDPAVFKDLERRVREYVSSGKTDEEALDHPEALQSVLKEINGDPADPRVQSAIEQVIKDRINVTMKASPGGKSIVVFSGISGVARIPGATELAADVDATLNYAVKRILEEKLPRMAKVQGYTRKALLIWSGIPFVDANDVRCQLQALNPSTVDGAFFVEFGKGRVSLVFDSGLKL